MTAQKNTVGAILMLDVSGSMQGAMDRLKINSMAFLNELLLPADQFGINQFGTTASWVYPKGNQPGIVTVSADRHEANEAKQEIDKLYASGLTNMGAAIELGNNMISQAKTDRKAFVLLSDGDWNQGSDPSTVLQAEPPIYVGGIGSLLNPAKFGPLLTKNPNSMYFNTPDVSGMMEMFSYIRGNVPSANILTNKSLDYIGTNYQKIPFLVTTQTGEVQFSIVWPDMRFKYTSGEPGGFKMRICIVDPYFKKVSTEPTVVGDGFCVFNLKNVKDGLWAAIIEHSVQENVRATVGTFEFGSDLKLDINSSNVQSNGDNLQYNVNLTENGQPVRDVKINCEIVRPKNSIANALIKYEKHIAELMSATPRTNALLTDTDSLTGLRLLRTKMLIAGQEDILGVVSHRQQLSFSKDGFYEGEKTKTDNSGSYTIKVVASGKSPVTGKPFEICQSRSVFVK